MKNFEKQLKNLPWAEPSKSLRQRIFTSTSSKRIPMLFRFSSRAIGWAAMWILIGTIIGYGAGYLQNDALAADEFLLVETDTDMRFLDQTDKIDAIPGDWSLYIEPSGGDQG